MRRFLITSTHFNGTAELHYNTDGLLDVVHMTQTTMTPEQRLKFKTLCPLTIDHLANKVGLPNTVTIVEAEFEATFEMFWHDYPYKRNKHLAQAYWLLMNKTEQVLAYSAVNGYVKYCDREKKWYNPKIADTWLKKKEYLNEWSKL